VEEKKTNSNARSEIPNILPCKSVEWPFPTVNSNEGEKKGCGVLQSKDVIYPEKSYSQPLQRTSKAFDGLNLGSKKIGHMDS